MSGGILGRLKDEAGQEVEAYTGGADRPLASLATIAGVYLALVATGSLLLRGKRPLPERVSFGDVAVLSVATHKLSRIVAKDSVTAPLRRAVHRAPGPCRRRRAPRSVCGARACARRSASW